MEFILKYWGIIVIVGSLFLGQWGSLLITKNELKSLKELFESELNGVNRRLDTMNGTVKKNCDRIEQVEDKLFEHVSKMHVRK